MKKVINILNKMNELKHEIGGCETVLATCRKLKGTSELYISGTYRDENHHLQKSCFAVDKELIDLILKSIHEQYQERGKELDAQMRSLLEELKCCE